MSSHALARALLSYISAEHLGIDCPAGVLWRTQRGSASQPIAVVCSPQASASIANSTPCPKQGRCLAPGLAWMRVLSRFGIRPVFVSGVLQANLRLPGCVAAQLPHKATRRGAMVIALRMTLRSRGLALRVAAGAVWRRAATPAER